MALVCCRVPPVCQDKLYDLSRRFPGKRVDEDFHITLCYLGPSYPVPDFIKACAALLAVTKKTPWFPVQFTMASWFAPRKNRFPIILPVESLALQDLQNRIKRTLDRANLAYTHDFVTFRPHLTVSYTEDSPRGVVPQIQPFGVVLDSIDVWPSDNGSDGGITLSLNRHSSPDIMYKSNISPLYGHSQERHAA